MKFHGITLEQGSNVSNLTVASGTSFPSSPDEGEMFFRSDSALNVRGLYLYVGGNWDRLASSDSLSAPTGMTLPSEQNDGDLFYLNTDDSNEGLYVYNGGAWVKVAGGASTFNITGDVTGTIDGGTDILTLATVNSNVGTFGNAGTSVTLTVNGKGLVTAAAGVPIEIGASQVTSGTFANALITESSVTQHEAALTILESQITDGSILARLAADETVTGFWTFAGTSGSGVEISGTGNGLFLNDTDSPADERKWAIGSDSSTLQILPMTDSYALTGASVTIDRDGDITTTGGISADGDIVLTPSAGSLINQNVAATFGAYWQMRRAGSTRWSAGMTSAAETGSDAGSLWILQSHTDAGAPKAVVMQASRDTGNVLFNNDVTAASFIGPLTGNADTATALETGRTFSVSGDATGTSAAFDGTANASIPLTLATVNSNVGSFGSASQTSTFTVNGKGLITAAGQTSINIAASQVGSGTFADARIAQSNVTQHQAALTILESQITDGSLLARNAGNETISGSWTFNNNVSLGSTPSAANHLVDKQYVDNLASGLDMKQSVRAATTANITLSGTQTIDGVSLVAGNRVLVKNQTTASQNGIYVVAAGAWTRSSDADNTPAGEVTSGMYTFVEEGTTNGDTGWVLSTNDPITLGTTSLTFTQFTGLGQITAGAGLTKTGSTIDVGTASASRIVVNADNIDLATTAVSPGTYNSVTVDTYGRVTGATNNVTGTGTTYVTNTSPSIAGASFTGTTNIGSSLIRDWSTADTDIDPLISGSGFGTILEGRESGHLTIGLRSNDANDGFQIISKGLASTPSTDPYTTLAFEVKQDGDIFWAGDAVGNALTLSGDTKQLVVNRNGSQYLAIQNSDTSVSPFITSFSSSGNAKPLNFRVTTDDADTALTAGSLGYIFKVYSTNVVTIGETGNLNWTGTAGGNGSGITNLNASNLSTGTIADGRLSSNVALKNAQNTFTNYQNITYSAAGGNTEVLRLNPTDYGIGKPGLYFKTGTVATNWIIGLWDTVGSTGSISIAASSIALTGVTTVQDTLIASSNINVSGNALFANGTAAAPSITFASDTDTGLYRRGTNQLGITTAGTEAAYFDADGNTNIVGSLGVKSATPSSSIAINSSITNSANGSRVGVQSISIGDNTVALTADRSLYASFNVAETQLQNAAAFSHNVYGAYNQARTTTSSGSSLAGEGRLYGALNYALHQSSDATYNKQVDVLGSSNEARVSGSTADATNLYGALNLANVQGAGSSASTAYGTRSRVVTGNATATIGSGYLLYADYSIAGTVTNRYGLFIPTATAYNYVAGGFQVGGTAATAGTTGIPGLGVGVAPTGTAGTIVSAGQHLTYSGDTVSAPGYSWAGDTDTGFYSPSAGNIAITTNGTEAMRFTSSNQILVGHTAALTSRTGNTSITPTIQTPGTSANASSIFQARYSANTGSAYLMFAKSRAGTVGSHTIVANGDILGTINFAGSDGTQFTEGARISAVVNGTPNTTGMPAELQFHTSSGASAAPSLALTLATDNSATFTGAVAATSFSGSGAALTSLNASNLSSGTVADARLSSNVALLNNTQTFTGNKTFNNPITFANGLFDVNGSGPGGQSNGLYVSSLEGTVGSTQNPTFTAVIGAQTSSARSIAVSVDGSGYIWGFRSHSNAGTYTFQSKTKAADALTTARTVGLSGVTATAQSFDGSANITIPVTAVPASLLTGTIADARISGAYTGITTLNMSGTLTVGGDIDCEVGINGGYNTTNGSGTNWGASVWAIGSGFDGSGLGTAFSTTGHYGLTWLRASHASANSFIGEGLYVYQAGTLRGGIGTGGIYSANTASATSATTGSIVAAGGIGCTNLYASGDITAFSDARIKTDVEVIPNALEKVEAIRGVTYTRTDNGDLDTGKRSTGVIAQEVLEVLPEAVVVNKEDPEALLGVNYGNMVGLLIEAIKELSAQNKELRAAVEDLKAKVER